MAPELVLDAHFSELQYSILRFAFSCSSLHESFWVSLLPAGERQQLTQRWVFVHAME